MKYIIKFALSLLFIIFLISPQFQAQAFKKNDTISITRMEDGDIMILNRDGNHSSSTDALSIEEIEEPYKECCQIIHLNQGDAVSIYENNNGSIQVKHKKNDQIDHYDSSYKIEEVAGLYEYCEIEFFLLPDE